MPSNNLSSASSQPRSCKKRKEPPSSSSGQKTTVETWNVKRVKTYAARSISIQATDAALKDGELDVQSFLKAREFEIKALQNGMQRAKKSLNGRALQKVPRDMRRRTASHNVKKLPKRLQKRAAKEMNDGNTPTVISRKRKPRSSSGRIRAETAKRLSILANKKRATKSKENPEAGVETRAAIPKLRKDKLNEPPRPKSKFRKRQIHKTWLPTHMWHAKRAKMTEPKNPLWRFAIPITPTEKVHRPTHRAGGARGAVAWDMSYMSTISLEGPEKSIEKLLRAVGVADDAQWKENGKKWRDGKRSWNGCLTKWHKEKTVLIGPATILWCPAEPQTVELAMDKSAKQSLRRLFVRIHPSAFLESWEELLRLAKQQRPSVCIFDLRFEIGSIEITGPGSTEALLGILHPYRQGLTQEAHAHMFVSLAGVTNPSSLPVGAVLAFSVMDPRLRYPPRPVVLPKFDNDEASFTLLKLLSEWPVDASTGSQAIFDRDARFKGTRLPSQKSINRRKALAPPGTYPSITEKDPAVPIILLASRPSASASSQGTWTLLAPWKCILPFWYGLMHYPLSSGGNPRFGGLQELRQIHFEHAIAWFPADFPGTNAGFSWEIEERSKRKAEWDRRPKGKRVEWDSLDLGSGRKGEIGRGWSCDFEHITKGPSILDKESSIDSQLRLLELPINQISGKNFSILLSKAGAEEPLSGTAVAAIRITLVNRGVARPCARIYRLPQASSSVGLSIPSTVPTSVRDQWLSLLPLSTKAKSAPNRKSKLAQNIERIRIPQNTPLPQRVRLLAQSLLQTPPLPYPAAPNANQGHPPLPDDTDLIGFVTTGEYNLADGKGGAIGCVFVGKILDGARSEGNRRFCIVRNSGERFGWLGRWDVVL